MTQGPLHNLGHALELPNFGLGRWVAQGGFAGEGVVPSELQMEKPSSTSSTSCPRCVSDCVLQQRNENRIIGIYWNMDDNNMDDNNMDDG